MQDLWDEFPDLAPSAIRRVLDSLEKKGLIAHAGDETMAYVNGVHWWSTATPTADDTVRWQRSSILLVYVRPGMERLEGMGEEGDKREPRRTPLPSDPWLNEGGTARLPEGFKIRGHDANALLDEYDRGVAEAEAERASGFEAALGPRFEETLQSAVEARDGVVWYYGAGRGVRAAARRSRLGRGGEAERPRPGGRGARIRLPRPGECEPTFDPAAVTELVGDGARPASWGAGR